ncbi:MAG: ABC transporter permease [Lachnospiraceae bacterium]|nr:ABC transporter permease [Lachnospiraceae bacterium]
MRITRYLLARLLIKNAKVFLSLVLITALGISVLTSMLNAYQCVREAFTDYFKDYAYPDVTITCALPVADTTAEALEELDGVERAEPRLVADLEASFGEHGHVSLRCFSEGASDSERYFVTDEVSDTPEEDVYEIGMEALFCELASFVPGNRFTVHAGETEHDAVLKETLASPEWVVVFRDEHYNYNTAEFGYARLAHQDLCDMTGMPEDCANQFLVTVETGADPEDVEKRIADSDIFDAEIHTYTYASSPHKEFVDLCLEPIRTSSYLVSAVFFLIAMVMTYLFMYQIIMEQKEKSGVLMALGASRAEIMALFVSFGIVAALFTMVIGNVLGVWITGILCETYRQSFYMPHVNVTYDPYLAVIASGIACLLILVSIFAAASQLLKLEPAKAMKHQSFTFTSHVPGFDVPFLGYAGKVCLFCALRNKRRLLLSFLSTCLTAALLVIAFRYVDAGRYVTEHTFTERFLYDCETGFDKPLSRADAEALMQKGEGIGRYELFAAKTLKIGNGDTEIETTLYGIEARSEMIALSDEQMNAVRPGENGIVLSVYAAEDLGVSEGDTVFVNGRELTVHAVHGENVVFVQYCTLATYASVEDDFVTGAFLTLEEGAAPYEVYESLSGDPAFSYLSEKKHQEEGIESRLSKTQIGVYLLIIMSLAIGMTIIYNMSLINFKERKKVFSVMMAIGVSEGRISGATYGEILVQYVISLITGYPVGFLIGREILQETSNNSILYRSVFSLTSAALIAACVLLFMTAGHLIAVGHLKKLELAEELKAGE